MIFGVGPTDVENVRVAEYLGITVGAGEQRDHALARRHTHSGHLGVPQSAAGGELYRRLDPQHFLHGVRPGPGDHPRAQLGAVKVLFKP